MRRQDFLDGLESIVDGDTPSAATTLVSGQDGKPNEQPKPDPGGGEKPKPDPSKPAPDQPKPGKPKPEKPEKPDPEKPDDDAKCQQLEVDVANKKILVDRLFDKILKHDAEIRRLEAIIVKLDDKLKEANIAEFLPNLIPASKLAKGVGEVVRRLGLPIGMVSEGLKDEIDKVTSQIEKQIRMSDDTNRFRQ